MAKAGETTEAGTSIEDGSVPDTHLRVKIRRKAHGRISTGERVNHKDLTYNEGDILIWPRDYAQDMLDRDLVDLA